MTDQEKIEELRREVYVLKAGLLALFNELQWRHDLDTWPIVYETNEAREYTLNREFNLGDYNV